MSRACRAPCPCCARTARCGACSRATGCACWRRTGRRWRTSRRSAARPGTRCWRRARRRACSASPSATPDRPAAMTVALFTHPACLAHDTGPGHPECAGPAARRAAGAGASGLRAPAARGGAGGDAGAAGARAPGRLRRRDPGACGRSRASCVQLDGDTLMSHGSRGRDPARGRRRVRGGGCGDGGLGAGGLRRHAAAGPPCGAAHGRWGSASSTTPPWRRCTRGRDGACSGSPWSTSTCTTATARRTSSSATRTCSTSAATSRPATPAPAPRPSAGWRTTSSTCRCRPGTGAPAFRAAWERGGPAGAGAFGPELLIISAGFDAHQADPLAELRLDTADFGWITDRLLAVADRCCGGRVVSVLEGGYDLRRWRRPPPCTCGG